MSETIKQYKKLLFTYPQKNQSFKTYAIVDSIRDEHIREKMVFTELSYLDLWDEELFENEQKVPLYLIELKEEDALTLWLIENHAKNAVIYFQSPHSLEVLQAYYSTFTFPFVEMETKGYDDTPKGIFGFYDPKVMPNYMQTLYSIEKADEFFAGMSFCVSPDVKEQNRANIFYFDAQYSLKHAYLDMQNKDNDFHIEKVYQRPYESLHIAIDRTIDIKQINILQKLKAKNFCKGVLDDLYAEGMLEKNKKDLPKAQNLMAYGWKELGLESQGNQARFITLGMSIDNDIKTYHNSKEFEVIKNKENQVEKRKVLQEMLKATNLKEVV